MSRVTLRTLRKSDVPKYLHQSERFVSCTQNTLSVPEDCTKLTPHIKSLIEMDHLFKTMQYWGLRTIPQELVHVLVHNFNPEIEETLLKYDATFPGIVPLLKDLTSQTDTHHCTIAAEHGEREFLQYFVKSNYTFNFYTVRLAAENGHLSCLSYLHDLYVRIQKPIDYKTFDYIQIIENGHVHILSFIVEHGRSISENMCVHAARCGQLNCLHYLLERSRHRAERIATAAAASNHLHCFQYTLEQRCTVGLSTWQAASACKDAHNLQCLFTTYPAFVCSAELVLIACRAGSVDCLRLLCENGCSVDKSAITAAAQGGSFECLQFLQNELEFDCWVPATLATAAGANHVKLVQKLVEVGCPGDNTVIEAAVKSSAKACLLYLFEQGKLQWK